MVNSLALLAFLALFPVAAQDLTPLPAETTRLIEEARSLPPEFSADILLRLADSRVIADRSWKRRLIEEAFRVGGRASLPYKKTGDATTDSRASRAYWDNGLEALTLQTRAVQALLPLDAQSARAMFIEIPNPEVPALSCQVTGAPNLAAYYETAAKLLEQTFTTQQREKLEHVEFIKDIVGRMRSPAHVTPAVKLIFRAPVTSAERLQLVNAFANMLPGIQGSPRVFGAATFQLVPVSAPVQMPAGIRPAAPLLEAPPGQLPQQVLETAPELLPALREYILKFVAGPRCSEDVRPGQMPRVVNDFNYLVSALDSGGSRYKPISADELRASSDAGTYERRFWWESNRSKQVIDALKWLNHGNRNLPDNSRFFTPEERATDEWNAHFVDTVRLIEGWKEIEEPSSEEWFGMVSEAYELLAELAPPGRQREAVMTRFMTFMETHYASTAPNLWFTQLKSQWRSKDAWIVDQFINSANPVMSLYARVNKRITE